MEMTRDAFHRKVQAGIGLRVEMVQRAMRHGWVPLSEHSFAGVVLWHENTRRWVRVAWCGSVSSESRG